MERNIALVLEYDGTRYSGWQIQENAITVQGYVQKALHTLTGEEISVNGCSRTDAGVHAAGYVLNFLTMATIPADKFALALNAFLPEDITAIDSYEVPADFHARFCAKRKTYRYLFYPASRPSALLSKRAWHVRSVDFDPADRDLWQEAAGRMHQAAQHFTGTHDFSAFRAVGSHVKTTVRTIYDAKVYLLPPDFITGHPIFCFEVTGDGFLYNMVRIMTGTLKDVMTGKIEPAEIPMILDSCKREAAGATAPPEGLYLYKVEY